MEDLTNTSCSVCIWPEGLIALTLYKPVVRSSKTNSPEEFTRTAMADDPCTASIVQLCNGLKFSASSASPSIVPLFCAMEFRDAVINNILVKKKRKVLIKILEKVNAKLYLTLLLTVIMQTCLRLL